MWPLLCATATVVSAKGTPSSQTSPCDTTEYSHMLNEITVQASPVIHKVDRQVIRPSKAQTETATGGLDLLRKLQLPRISLHPLTDEVTLNGSGSVELRINGISANTAMVKALLPEDIVRIEYHDTPGARYEGYDAVIDFITRHHDSGGNISIDSFTAFEAVRWATIDHVAALYNRGQSSWTFNAGYMGQQKDKWVRDYEEVWHYPDYDLSRREVGMPITVGDGGVESNLAYNHMHPDGHLLNIRLGFDFSYTPNKEEGDRKASLYLSDNPIPVTVTEHTEEHSATPDINLHYLHKLNEHNSLTLEANVSYMKSRMLHEYQEDNTGYESRVNGHAYNSKINLIFENRIGSRVWSAGVIQTNSSTSNRYTDLKSSTIRSYRAETMAYGEYGTRFGSWGIMADMRITHRHASQGDYSLNRFFVEPSANVSFRPTDNWFIKYDIQLNHRLPSIAALSDVIQTIQPGMIRRGNPSLNPYRCIDQSVTAAFDHRYFSLEGQVAYRNENRPVMGSVIYEEGTFVNTFFNQKSFQKLTADASLTIKPWNDHLSLSANPSLTRYFSHGYDYRHCHTIFRLGLGLDFNYGHWLLYGNIMSGPANDMYGEEIIEEKDMNTIMAGYIHGSWSLHLGVFNAFMKDYWMETRNLSALTPYTSRAYSARSCSYIAAKFTLSLDFGKKTKVIDIPRTHHDIDSGILTGTK